jgi:flavin reductase (DIM6/NTAB) family NADH-FMN oxidoreductase RutF
MDTRTYRDLIGRFATGVTVVTTEAHGKLHGMTANAVSSVSLDPILLLVCVGHGSTCHQQMLATERFGVNILREDQEELSNLFAISADAEEDRLRGAEYFVSGSGVPLLSDCLATLECHKHEALRGGDHDIFLGEVIDGRIEDRDAQPLVFWNGLYRQLAQP